MSTGSDFLDTLEFSTEDFLSEGVSDDIEDGLVRTIREDSLSLDLETPRVDDDDEILEDYSESTDSLENEMEEDDELFAFVNMVENEQIGSLEEEDISIMRDIVRSPIITDEETQESLELRGKVLYRLVDEWLATSDEQAAPSVDDFTMCLKGWVGLFRSDDDPTLISTLLSTAVDSVFKLWLDLEHLYAETKNEGLKPTADTAELALELFALAPSFGLDRQAESILQSAVHKHGIAPTPAMYETVIYLLAKSRAPGAAGRAERVLRDACEQVAATDLSIDTFNVVLTSWAKSRDTNSPERAEQVLIFMTENDVKPNASSFTSLIDAYGQKTDWECAIRCEGILMRMLNLYLEGDKNLEPSIVSWAVVMSTWTRLSKKGFTGAVEKGEKVLQQLEKLYANKRVSTGPDAMIYVTCMNANIFSKTAKGLNRAIDILDEMNEVYLDGDVTYKPTARSIHMVVDGLIHSTIPNKLVKAETVLEKYKSMLLEDAKAPQEEADGRVKDLWRSMIYGWAQAGNPIQAQHYLMEMVDYNLALDSACFDRVIESNYKTGDNRAMMRCAEVFEAMERCRLEGRVKPNERVYTSFIRAMCRSHVPEVASKALSLIERMTELYHEGNMGIKPTVFTYNALLFACSSAAESSSSNDRKLTLQIALSTFDTLRNGSKNMHPDHVSFGNMLRCAKLLPQDDSKQDTWIQSTFQLCCQRGLVNTFVLNDLQQAASPELFEHLVGLPSEAIGSLEDLPPDWTRNTAQKMPKTSGQRTTARRNRSNSTYSR